jgi:phage protein D
MLSRRSFLKVEIDGTDISKAVSDFILDFTYTDRASGESDSIDLNVTDRDGKFIDNWYPMAESGINFRGKICVANWYRAGDSDDLDTGKFKIDSCGLSGPPDKFSIKAVSIPVTSSLKREEKTKTWEKATLQEIAKTIANNAGVQLMYEVESDIKFDHVDQLLQTDMSFLMDLCTRYGVSLKVTDEKMVLFEESVYEGKDSIDAFDKSEIGSRIIDYSFTQDINDTVKKVELLYKDPKSGTVAQGEFTPPNPPATGQKLVLNERPGDLRGDNFREGVDNSSGSAGGTFDTGMRPFNDILVDFNKPRTDVTDNANRICRAYCRKKNKNEWTCVLKMVGNVKMVGGVTINMTNWGKYSGKYMVDTASHKISGRYITTVNAHRVLGY